MFAYETATAPRGCYCLYGILRPLCRYTGVLHLHWKDQKQKVNVVCKDKDLKWIINQLEKQTGTLFVYSNDELNLSQKLSLRTQGYRIRRCTAKDLYAAPHCI